MTVHIENIHIDLVTITAPAAPSLRWHIGPMVLIHPGGTMPIDVTTTTEYKVRVRIAPTTPGGAPGQVDGEPQWDITGSGSLAALVPEDPPDEAGEFSIWAMPPTSMGECVVTATCDADLGEGVMHLVDTATIHWGNPMSASLGMSADEPVLVTPPPAA